MTSGSRDQYKSHCNKEHGPKIRTYLTSIPFVIESDVPLSDEDLEAIQENVAKIEDKYGTLAGIEEYNRAYTELIQQ